MIKDRLERINDCLASLGPDPDSNITRLTGLAGELLSADCALYNRLEDGFLYSAGQWQTPPGFEAKGSPEGHICHDVICGNKDNVVCIGNLPETAYADSDPNVRKYGLQTYCGQVVRCGDTPVGSLCVVYQSDHQIDDEDRRILGIIASAIGSENRRRHVQEDLRASQRRLAIAMDLAHLVHWECDIQNATFVFDDNFYALYGTTAKDEGGRFMSAQTYAQKFVHPEDAHVVAAEIEKAISTTDPDYSGYLEHRIIRADGQERFIAVRYRIVKDSAGRTVKTYGANQDITDRKSLEAQLLHAQKMEALGTLAGGIAHDFNNILMAITGYGNLVLMKMKSDDPLRVDVDHILSSAGKAATLTHSLLAFSRKQLIELKPQSLHPALIEMEKLLLRILPEDIAIRMVLPDDDITVSMDIAQMDQVFLNLATNARDAMPAGGILTIEARLFSIDSHFIETHNYGRPGEYALISVSDTGIGIDRNIMDKIFEPFFTTKEVGKGTGLGLSTVYGIIKQHDGYIVAESEPGKETKFSIYLPVKQMKSTEAVNEPPSPVKGGTETILLAEDNEDVRVVAGSFLSAAGYGVIEAKDGEDALRQFHAHCGTIDMLILDVVMPRMNGKEVYEEILKMETRMKALFISGYTRDVVINKGFRDGNFDYLPKPLSPRQLLQRVREMLDR